MPQLAIIRKREASGGAQLVRLGYAAIPIFVLVAMLKSWWRLLRFGPAYGLAWYELPVGFAAATVLCAMQAPAMWKALSGKPVVERDAAWTGSCGDECGPDVGADRSRTVHARLALRESPTYDPAMRRTPLTANPVTP